MGVILASESKYRIQQLKDFGLEFKAIRPDIDEEALKRGAAKLKPRALTRYLARKKAESLAEKHPHALIIGADQAVSLKGFVLGKPKTRERAIEMLLKMSGKSHQLITSVAIYYEGQILEETVIATVKMRKLNRQEVIQYVYRDEPYDCAGSYKFEKSGLSLVAKLSCPDPSALIGLPLIALSRLIRKSGAKAVFR